MKWYEFTIKTNRDNEDLLTYILYDIGAKGLEIIDNDTINEVISQKDKWDFIDIEINQNLNEFILIKSYFSEVDDIEKIKSLIEEEIGKKDLGSISINIRDESEWAENWKAFFNTLRIGNNIIIKPSWEKHKPNDRDIVIELDPGMAFGTGMHETTYMCGQALENLNLQGKTVFDIGCGSGILSIIAAKLGANRVIGVDLDLTSVEIANRNIVDNQVNSIVEIRHGDLLSQIDEKADLIVMNIVAEVVANTIPILNEYLVENGIFVCSGIIDSKKDIVLDSLNKNDFEILEIKNMNDWICIVAKRR
ncbi:MAG: 50S ribosomal protein L11 methyltransferase [Tissierellales bacterium]|nr:50S ribosomal protein L11 methyltransferase [Tissierellales bacterium]